MTNHLTSPLLRFRRYAKQLHPKQVNYLDMINKDRNE